MTRPMYNPLEHQYLSSDEVELWRGMFFASHQSLNSWFEDHTLLAMERCPNAVQLWRQETGASEARQLHLVSCALHGLGDLEKLAVLDGRGQGEAQQFVGRHIGANSEYFDTLSPAWVGPPGSSLRQKAVELGWTHRFLLKQVAWCIGRADAVQWANWVAYPQSIALMEEFAWDQEVDGAALGAKRNCARWVHAADLALSLCLLKRLPWKSAPGMMVAHADMRAIPLAVQKRVDDAVLPYIELGLFHALQACILDGTLLDASPGLALPTEFEHAGL